MNFSEFIAKHKIIIIAVIFLILATIGIIYLIKNKEMLGFSDKIKDPTINKRGGYLSGEGSVVNLPGENYTEQLETYDQITNPENHSLAEMNAAIEKQASAPSMMDKIQQPSATSALGFPLQKQYLGIGISDKKAYDNAFLGGEMGMPGTIFPNMAAPDYVHSTMVPYGVTSSIKK
jgi:hypothetical protein